MPLNATGNATNSIYNLGNFSNAVDPFQFMETVNNLTGQTFMIGILLVWLVILFVTFKRFGNQEAMLGAGFITCVTAVLFSALDLVPKWLVLILVVAYGLFFAYRMGKE